jgi:hypothetical protein
MTASLPCQKPQYYQWKNEAKQVKENAEEADYLLLPLKHKFNEGGVCSTSGELTVRLLRGRSSTITILNCSQPRSGTA